MSVQVEDRPLQPSWGQLAREEFVTTAKVFFWPIYGLSLVMSDLRAEDRRRAARAKTPSEAPQHDPAAAA